MLEEEEEKECVPSGVTSSGAREASWLENFRTIHHSEECSSDARRGRLLLGRAADTCVVLPQFVLGDGDGRDCRLLFPGQTQESIQRFEQQAGLREAGYTPHKGLTTEETKYLCVAEALHVSLLLRDLEKPSPRHSSFGRGLRVSSYQLS